PQTGTQNGAIYTSPLANASAFYGNEKIFSELIFENSHLNRLKQKIHEGNSWSSNPIKYDYDTNVVGEVIKYSSESIWSNGTTSSNLKILGFFSPNQLYKNSVTDEDGNPKIIYSTLENKIVLIRKPLSPTQNIDTYYVYDEYNNLTFIIQPKGVEATKNLPPNTDISSTVKYELTYQYKYDERRRVVEKKNPGDAWSYMIYDKQDRLVATRNDILRSQGKWQFLQYDQFGRIAYTGLAYGGERAEVQQTVDLLNGYHVIRSSTAISHSNIDIYYCAPTPVYPSQNHWDKILTVNYYDTYPPGAPTIPIQILDQDVLQSSQSNIVSTKSLPTAAFVNIVEDDSWTKTYSWYDKKGRVIGSLSNNFLGGYTKTEMLLDFVGNVLQNNTYHKRLPSENETRVSETFEYDDLNRLLILKNKINNGPIEYLTQNGYNELGELTRKKVGGSSLGNHLQEENYLYNIRGWLSSVNDPNNLGADIFGYKIRYNNVEGLEHPDASDILLKVIPKYNGNIAEIDWKTSTEENEPLKRYGYVYDAQNRLLAGFYQKSTNPSAREFYEKVTYDLNGNISTIKRTGRQISPTSSLQIDNLIYQYYDNNLSNKLKTISETTQINSGYPYVPMPTDIVYDNSGNMISFNDKQISDIQYNYLNLPKQISKGAQITNLIYRVDGIKVKKTYNTLETIYLDGFQHKSTYPSEFDGYIDPSQTPQTRLRIIPTSEGYYDVL
ncbi:MAG TPA: RHS repeat-associated core domain-containing protein, partial [Candidatus Woesebacteria bacterium]|nr:RHS repeat-associated core domain-containing protein [Candidatus Woesebacteria bacterium]